MPFKFFLTALDRLALFQYLLIGRSVNDRIESPQDPLITIINTDVFANALPRILDDVKTVQVTCRDNIGISRRRRSPQEYKSTGLGARASLLVNGRSSSRGGCMPWRCDWHLDLERTWQAVKAVVRAAVKSDQYLMVNSRGRTKLPRRAEAVNLFEPCYHTSYLVCQGWHLSIAPQPSLRTADRGEIWSRVPL